QCKAITTPYKCTPALHAMNALVCERGDLSGKNLETCRCLVIEGGRITHTWVDDHYPTSKQARRSGTCCCKRFATPPRHAWLVPLDSPPMTAYTPRLWVSLPPSSS
ncbi:hypothetical protein DYB31_001269, partial [Aphanomyces astaci]